MNNEDPKNSRLKINLNIFWFIIILLTTIFITTIITALSLNGNTERAVNVGTDTRQEFAKLYNVYDTLSKEYYTDVDKDELIESSIKGMVEGLNDPYSEYMLPEQTEEFEESITGDFHGIGAELMQDDQSIIISSPMKGSPAEDAGLQSGDKIIEIDEESTQDFTTQDAVKRIRGEKGTDVTLTIQRGSDKPFNVTITRDKIHVDSVTSEIKDNVAHISVNRFQQETANELKNALEEAKDKEVEDIILDFRSNPGGLLNEAVDMINFFVNKGKLVLYLENKFGDREKVIAENDQIIREDDFDNIYILLNEGSASASEVFAGAMRDLTDAEIIGTKSFGKGIVQRSSEFKDNSLVKYTNTKWLTPSGDWIHEKGLEPDFVINTPDFYRVKFLDSEDAYIESQSNDDIISIKVMLDALGYDVDTIDNNFDSNLTDVVQQYQNDKDLESNGIVTGDTTEQLMKDIREHIKENDVQLEYLLDYIEGKKSKEEITKEMKENSKYIPVDESRKRELDEDGEE